MTSVLGHLLSYEFDPRYKSWTSCDPCALFDARIEVFVASNGKPVADNIKQQARQADLLYIWTDCDREGEHIGTEIRSVAKQSNQTLGCAGGTIRARFSNIERAHIIHAAQHPTDLDEAQANAVASRIELDLRVGASLTRHLTLTLRPILHRENLSESSPLISYGSCQFPTLGFIVERYLRVRNFIPETFWVIKLLYQKAGIKVNFSWARKHLFDRMTAIVLYEWCLNSQTAQVQKVKTKPTSKWRPLPLTTLELQKCGSRFLGMNSQKILQLAEKLYQKGWISYPRTETDHKDAHGSKTDISIRYGPETFNTSGLVVLEHNYLDVYVYDRWGSQELPPFLEGEVFEPTEAILSEGKTSPPEYLTEPDLLSRMDANGIGTDATMADHIATIIDRQYVEARAQRRQARQGNDEEGSDELPTQARFSNSCQGRNEIPCRSAGSNSGAGRGHSGAATGIREFIPTTLGVALVECHDNMGFETNLTKPFLRKEMELKMKAICNGQITKAQVVNETIEQYREVYTRMKQHPEVLRTAVRKYVFGDVN
ncbi:DNA topoisomerase [Curvularia clavata]|uniref:DNA topoisomerase n=1 Tax=Curvularia clavata TaxID=95742 RepID=A0A9Q8Z183_CURCL|nr:DNA topoisomerase [Curvularia clavata]